MPRFRREVRNGDCGFPCQHLPVLYAPDDQEGGGRKNFTPEAGGDRFAMDLRVLATGEELRRNMPQPALQVLGIVVGAGSVRAIFHLHTPRLQIPHHWETENGRRTEDRLLLRKMRQFPGGCMEPVSYTHLRAHETRHDLVCRL